MHCSACAAQRVLLRLRRSVVSAFADWWRAFGQVGVESGRICAGGIEVSTSWSPAVKGLGAKGVDRHRKAVTTGLTGSQNLDRVGRVLGSSSITDPRQQLRNRRSSTSDARQQTADQYDGDDRGVRFRRMAVREIVAPALRTLRLYRSRSLPHVFLLASNPPQRSPAGPAVPCRLAGVPQQQCGVLSNPEQR